MLVKKLLYVLLVSVVVIGTNAGSVAALSKEQKKVLDSGITFFNVEDTQISCYSAVTLSGSTNEEKVWNYLINDMGFSATQAAGAMANIKYESGFSPYALNPSTTSPTPVSTGRAWGLIQWLGGRQTGLINFAAERNHTFGQDENADLGIQLEFMKHELETGYKSSTLDPILASTTVEESTRIWLEKYEAPCPNSKDPNCDIHFGERLPFAQDYLARFGSNLGGTGGSSGCGGSGQIVGGLSLPTERSYYDEHTDFFTKPHHDYPASDIPMPEGTPIYSMTAGRVYSAAQGGKCGLGITIETENGIRFNYCHGIDGGSVPGAKLGDQVTAGQLIMHSGNTGNSTGPHLHLGITTPDDALRCPQTLFVGIANGSPPDILSLPTSGCTY